MGTGKQPAVPERENKFRYLQGYMGTHFVSGYDRLSQLFRYLQGYMGTLSQLSSPGWLIDLDTFKDIWDLLRSSEAVRLCVI